MFSIIIPTLQQDNYVLNMLLYELLNSACVGEIIIINNACKEMMFSDKKLESLIPIKIFMSIRHGSLVLERAGSNILVY